MKRALLVLLGLALVAGLWYFLRAEDSGGAREERVAVQPSQLPGTTPDDPSAESVELESLQAAEEDPLLRTDVAVGFEQQPESAPFFGKEQGLMGRVFGQSKAQGQAVISLVDDRGKTVGSCTSDSFGGFTLNLPRAVDNATLRVLSAGFAPFESGPYNIRLGEQRQVGVIRLVAGTALAGFVVDSRGRPVRDAEVSVSPSGRGARGGRRSVSKARTDKNGRFEVKDAPRGRVRVAARARGHGGRAIDPLGIPTQTVPKIELVAARGLTVRALDLEGQPIQDALIQLSPTDNLALKEEGRTDSDGLRTFETLGAETWQLTATAKRFLPTVISRVDADGTEVDVKLKPWPCFEGFVLLPNGNPAPEGTVVHVREAEERGTFAVSLGDPSAEVDAAGGFKLCNVQRGTFVVQAVAPGHAPTASQVVRVNVDSRLPPLSITLQAGGGLTTSVACEGVAIQQAQVELYVNEPPRTELLRSSKILVPRKPSLHSARTDEKGVVTFEHLAGGQVWLVVYAEGYVPQMSGPYLVSPNRVLKASSVSLEVGSRLQGKVTDGNGSPMPGIPVTLSPLSTRKIPTYQVQTDSQGFYESEFLPAGSYRVTAQTQNSSVVRPAMERATLKAGETLILDMTLE